MPADWKSNLHVQHKSAHFELLSTICQSPFFNCKMKLRTRGRQSAIRYVTDNDTPLESQDAQAAAVDPLIKDILGRLPKVESILSILLGQDYDRYWRSTHHPSRPTTSCGEVGVGCRYSRLWSWHFTNFNYSSHRRNNFFWIAAQYLSRWRSLARGHRNASRSCHAT